MKRQIWRVGKDFLTIGMLSNYIDLLSIATASHHQHLNKLCEKKLKTYTIGLYFSWIESLFLPQALISKPICGPFHNAHVFHRISVSLCLRSLTSRDEGESPGTKKEEVGSTKKLKRFYGKQILFQRITVFDVTKNKLKKFVIEIILRIFCCKSAFTLRKKWIPFEMFTKYVLKS